MLAVGCQRDLAEMDGIYSGDGFRRVHCAVNLDRNARNSSASIDSGLDRAADRGEIIELYAHNPGKTVSLDLLEHVLSGAVDRGLAFVTYAQLADGTAGPGIALSFDDNSISAWIDARPLFATYGARVTFFVSRYLQLSQTSRDELRVLAGDGHDIEAHSVLHERAPAYVEERGLAAYLADEALPSIDLLRADGYPVRAYAYPFGARTSQLDAALLEHVDVVRSVAFSYSGGVEDPCPY